MESLTKMTQRYHLITTAFCQSSVDPGCLFTAHHSLFTHSFTEQTWIHHLWRLGIILSFGRNSNNDVGSGPASSMGDDKYSAQNLAIVKTALK